MTPEEFISLYLPLGDGLYRVAYRVLGSRQEAEDAVQDLYIKLWVDLDSLDSIRNPQAWSMTLLRNLCIDRIRARGDRHPAVTLAEDLPDEGPPPSSERLEKTLAAVRALPAKSRELLRLHLVEGLSYQEIAQLTEQSELALRVAFHRLKNKLKSQI